jgi:[ribosomal protein S5]-alanine N-acetyltransferase
MSYNISKSLYEVPNPYTIEDAINFILASDKDFDSLRAIHFAIDYNIYESGNSFQRIIGIISLKNVDLINKKANLGYWIGEGFWGKGIATECVKLVIGYGFTELKLDKVSACVYPENKASIRVLEKNGLSRNGEINEYCSISKTFRNSLKYVVHKNR